MAEQGARPGSPENRSRDWPYAPRFQKFGDAPVFFRTHARRMPARRQNQAPLDGRSTATIMRLACARRGVALQHIWRSVRASGEERTCALPGDERIPQAIDSLTHGVTIRRPPGDVWPWLVQMGAGSRAGWYSYDWLDNGRQPSARRIVPELQHPAIGTVFPALPGMKEGFTLLALEHERALVLGFVSANGTTEVTWAFHLTEVTRGVTRLVVRARGGPGYRFHGLPLLLTRIVVRVVHFVMQQKQLLGLASRAEGQAERTGAAASDGKKEAA